MQKPNTMREIKYFTDEERIEASKEYCKRWYWKNREEKIQRLKEYYKTPNGRASMLLCAYNKRDKKYNRGKGDLTAKWISENILTKPCAHCGKKGWQVIGCNRINNDLPHTKDNVEPCCFECNNKLASEYRKKTKKKKGND